MKAIVSVCVFGAVAMMALAAPTLDGGVPPNQPQENVLKVHPHPDIVRQKRSFDKFGAPSYSAPCGTPYHVPAIAPSYMPIHGGYGGASHSYGGTYGGSYGYGAPHYRADDTGDESFPDMENMMSEHLPMARFSAYGAIPAAHGLTGYGPGVATGPAYGIFPNANVGGCNVPLLLSCSPSIVPGRLVKSGYGGYGGGPANAYRGVDEGHQEVDEQHEEHEAAHEQLSGAADASHPTSSHQ